LKSAFGRNRQVEDGRLSVHVALCTVDLVLWASVIVSRQVSQLSRGFAT